MPTTHNFNLDDLRVAILVQKYRKDKDRKEWALVSKKDRSKILEWYGTSKPSKDRVNKTERRVQMFKHMGSVSAIIAQAAPEVVSPTEPPPTLKTLFKAPGWKLYSGKAPQGEKLQAVNSNVSATVFYGSPSVNAPAAEGVPAPATLTLIFTAFIPADAPKTTLMLAKKLGLKPTPDISAKQGAGTRRTWAQVVSIPLSIFAQHKDIVAKLWTNKLLKLTSLNNLLPMVKKTGFLATIRGLLSKLFKSKPVAGGPSPVKI